MLHGRRIHAYYMTSFKLTFVVEIQCLHHLFFACENNAKLLSKFVMVSLSRNLRMTLISEIRLEGLCERFTQTFVKLARFHQCGPVDMKECFR